MRRKSTFNKTLVEFGGILMDNTSYIYIYVCVCVNNDNFVNTEINEAL